MGIVISILVSLVSTLIADEIRDLVRLAVKKIRETPTEREKEICLKALLRS